MDTFCFVVLATGFAGLCLLINELYNQAWAGACWLWKKLQNLG